MRKTIKGPISFFLAGVGDDQPIASLEDAVGLADLSAYEKRCSWHNRVTLQLVDIDMENPTCVGHFL